VKIFSALAYRFLKWHKKVKVRFLQLNASADTAQVAVRRFETNRLDNVIGGI